jgi:hypothetical protein
MRNYLLNKKIAVEGAFNIFNTGSTYTNIPYYQNLFSINYLNTTFTKIQIIFQNKYILREHRLITGVLLYIIV